MDLREALYIVTIHEHNGISNAAKHLNIAQSSLSRCLQSVEQQIGEPLFIRGNTEYTPTYTGTQFLTYANQLLAVHKEWEIECLRIKNQEYGTLNISIPLVHSLSIMSNILPEFKKRYPHIIVNLKEESKWIDLDLIRNESIDLAIYTSHKIPEGLDYEILGRDEILLATPKGHTISKSSFHVEDRTYPCLELEQVLSKPFVMLTNDQLTGMYMEDYFLEQHISPGVSITTRNHEVALDLTCKNLGFTFIPRSYASNYQNNKPFDLYHFHKPSVDLSLLATYKNKSDLSDYALYFLELVRIFSPTITDVI